jgi:hypothetical protein
MPIFLALLAAFVQLAPVLMPIIQRKIDRGEDPNTIDWKQEWYGRSAADLRAEVDQQEREDHTI